MKIKVLSHNLFDDHMREMGLSDSNVENTNMVFISIIGTQECLKYYLDEEDTKHYFKDHSNVLNLDFDDISSDVNYNGHIFKTMTMKQAEDAVDFIEKNISDKIDTVFIHCRAGMSRSRAFAEFICRYCQENSVDADYEERNDYVMVLNQGVLRRLSHAYHKKNKMYEYVFDGTDYPSDLVNTVCRVIDTEKEET